MASDAVTAGAAGASYEGPVLTVLGTVAELTRGTGKTGSDMGTGHNHS